MTPDPDATIPSGSDDVAGDVPPSAFGAAGPVAGATAGSDERPGDPPGLRTQIGNVVEAVKRLVRAHVDLAKTEIGAIAGEIGRAAALGGLAFGLVFLAGLLLPIGLLLFLGDWLFGSIGWGVLLGTLLLVDLAVVAVLTALEVGGGRIGRAFIVSALLGIAVGVVLGLDLTNRGWTALGDEVLPTVDEGIRPLVMAAATLGIVGAVLGLVAGLRGGSAAGGLLAGAVAGVILGALTALALGPQVGAAFGVLAALIAWPVLLGLDVSRAGIDGAALKARFWPDQTIETTKETIEWLRQRTPLGRGS